MKKTAVIIAITGFLLSASSVSAEVNVSVSGNSSSNVSVHQEGSSSVTTCINGKCESSDNTGKTTICKNGECTTTDSGKYEYNSEDGNTEIHMNADTSVAVSKTEILPTVETPDVTITPNPTVVEKVKEAESKISAAKNEVKETKEAIKLRLKSHESGLSEFLQHFFEGLFK